MSTDNSLKNNVDKITRKIDDLLDEIDSQTNQTDLKTITDDIVNFIEKRNKTKQNAIQYIKTQYETTIQNLKTPNFTEEPDINDRNEIRLKSSVLMSVLIHFLPNEENTLISNIQTASEEYDKKYDAYMVSKNPDQDTILIEINNLIAEIDYDKNPNIMEKITQIQTNYDNLLKKLTINNQITAANSYFEAIDKFEVADTAAAEKAAAEKAANTKKTGLLNRLKKSIIGGKRKSHRTKKNAYRKLVSRKLVNKKRASNKKRGTQKRK